MAKCIRLGCLNKATDKGRCNRHQTVLANALPDRVRPIYHNYYSKKEWKQLRRSILITTPLCECCKLYKQATEATDVDHILPHRGDRELFLNTTNLQALCHSCHSSKTGAEGKGVYKDYKHNCAHNTNNNTYYAIVNGIEWSDEWLRGGMGG